MYTPIYAGPSLGTLVGFLAINVHWIDIGGITPSSSDIFMEGLQLPSIKRWSKGEPIQEAYRIIENNTRFPVISRRKMPAVCLAAISPKRWPISTVLRRFWRR
jgi:N-methylhydantoinase B